MTMKIQLINEMEMKGVSLFICYFEPVIFHVEALFLQMRCFEVY